jgi:hypothetical protein
VKGVTALHKKVGAELAALERSVGRNLTADLQRRYRTISLAGALQTAPRRVALHGVLTQLRNEIAKMRVVE